MTRRTVYINGYGYVTTHSKALVGAGFVDVIKNIFSSAKKIAPAIMNKIPQSAIDTGKTAAKSALTAGAKAAGEKIGNKVAMKVVGSPKKPSPTKQVEMESKDMGPLRHLSLLPTKTERKDKRIGLPDDVLKALHGSGVKTKKQRGRGLKSLV